MFAHINNRQTLRRKMNNETKFDTETVYQQPLITQFYRSSYYYDHVYGGFANFLAVVPLARTVLRRK